MSRATEAGPSASSDEDSISVTSTRLSEPQQEYFVEAVLAERTSSGGKTKYLVKWEGYPEERCTWEKAANFSSEKSLQDWEHQKMRIKRGLDKPYNVSALEKKVERIEEESEKRKGRRRAKRLRLGIPLPPEKKVDERPSEEDSSEEESSSEGGDEHSDRSSPRKRKESSHDFRKDGLLGFVISDSEGSEPKSRGKHGVQSENDESGGESEKDLSTDDSLVQDLKRRTRRKSGRDVPNQDRTDANVNKSKVAKKNQTQRPESNAPQKRWTGTAKAVSAVAPASSSGLRNKAIPNANKARLGDNGPGRARVGHRPSTALSNSVLKNWSATPKIRKKTRLPQHGASSLGEGSFGQFSKLSVQRKFEKAGRNEPAPNPELLDFVDLKDGRAIPKPPRAPLTVPVPKKTPFEIYREKLSNEARDQTKGQRTDSDPQVPTIEAPKPTDNDDDRFDPMEIDSNEPQLSRTAQDARTIGQPISNIDSITPLDPPKGPRNPYASVRTPRRISTQFKPLDSSSFTSHDVPDLATTPILAEVARPISDLTPEIKSSVIPPSLKTIAPPALREDGKDIVYANMFARPEYQNVGKVQFRGCNKETKYTLLNIRVEKNQVNLWFKDICTAEDWKTYFHGGSWYIGRAIVLPSPSAMRAVEVMAETLKSNVAGGAFFHKDFTTIVYPSASEAWRFIEEDFPSDLPPAQLHCVVCRPFIGSLLQNTNRSVNAQMILTMEGEKGVNVFFREQFGIDYAKLVPGSANRKNDQPNNFFLMYPQSASEEHEVVVNFLRANNTTIFSSYTAGSWEYFCTCINGGVLLIHPSFQNLHLIPYLSRLITRKTLNIFSITLSPPPEEPNLIRLFPHGGVILITDSLILLHPSLAVRILKWFRLFILTTKPSWTWKIALRPHFRSWILDIVEERSAESLDSGKIFTAIYEQIYYLLPLEMMEDWDDYETPKDEAAAVSASDLSRFDKGVGLDPKRHDLEALAKNDARLVEWFAGWARTKVEDHRKFHAVCPEIEEEGEISGEEARKEWGKKWNHIHILTPDELFKAHQIPAWEAKYAEKMKEKDRNGQQLVKRRGEADAVVGVER